MEKMRIKKLGLSENKLKSLSENLNLNFKLLWDECEKGIKIRRNQNILFEKLFCCYFHVLVYALLPFFNIYQLLFKSLL